MLEVKGSMKSQLVRIRRAFAITVAISLASAGCQVAGGADRKYPYRRAARAREPAGWPSGVPRLPHRLWP